MSELLSHNFDEGLTNEDQDRKRASLEKIEDSIITELRVTETNLPWAQIGVHPDKTMIENFKVKDRIAEEIRQRANEAAERYLDSDNPDYNPYLAFKIAGDFILDRQVLQKAGDTYINEALAKHKGDTETSRNRRLVVFEIMINRGILDWDYHPNLEVLREGITTFLKNTDQTSSPNVAMKWYGMIQEKDSRVQEIVENDPELMEILTCSETE